MRKILLLMVALLGLGVSGAWADVTVTINDQTDLANITNTSTSEATATHKYGVFSGSTEANKPYYTTFPTNDTHVEGLILSTSAKIMKPTYVASSYAGYGHVLAIYPDNSDTEAYTFTIAAPTGYYIKSYSFKAISTSSGGTFDITLAGGNETNVSSTRTDFSYTNTYNTLCENTTFTVKRHASSDKTLCISQFYVTLAEIPTYDESFTEVTINNVGDFGHDGCSNTASTWYCKWTSTSAPAGLALRTGGWNNMVWNSSNSALNIHSANGPTYTLTAPSGYIIAGYTIAIYAGAADSKITPSGGTEISISTDSSNPTYVFVSGLSTKSTSFTRTGTSTNGFATTFKVYLRPAVGITYVVKNSGGTTLYTSDAVDVEQGTTITSLPAAFKRDFCTYSEVNVVADAAKAVEFTATWDFPFEISSTYESAHWYDMAIRSTWYVTSDQIDNDGALATVNANAMGLATDPYQWAFVGDPYNLKLYNKDKGKNYVYAWTSAANQNIPTFVDAATGNTWAIKASTASGYTNAFMLTIPEYGYQVNQFGGEGGSLKVWNNSTKLDDPGSAFEIFDVPDDFATYVTSEIAPYMESEATYFNWTDAARTAIGYNASYKNSCPYATYASMKTALTAKLADLNNNVTFPPSGYYRIKNVNSNNYIGYGTAGYSGKGDGLIEVNASDVSSVLKLTGSNGVYTISTQGLNAQTQDTRNAVVPATSSAGSNYTLSAQSLGQFNMRANTSDAQGYLFRSSWGSAPESIITWDASGNSAWWTIEEAKTVSIPLHEVDSKYYGTMCLPFDVTLPTPSMGNAVFACRVSISGNRAQLTSLANRDIPAGTPVLLYGEGCGTSIDVTITSGAAAIEDENALEGTYVGKSSLESNEYIFGTSDGELGFWKMKSGSKVGANKAYLVYNGDPSNVKGFSIDFGSITGINAIENGMQTQDNAIYDLSGRRVSKPTQGLYIKNGKKILVK